MIKGSTKIHAVLFLANVILIAAGWISALYAYPRLPPQMPLWLNFLSQDVLKNNRSLLFFIYPSAQFLFSLAFFLLWKSVRYRHLFFGEELKSLSGEKKDRILDLEQEFLWLSLIFFNMIFIHIQTSLILLSRQASQGINEFYFSGLFGILLMLIPYYRIKRKLVLKKTL